ncbi:hypothetical protein CEXT_552201 [Caerostris extrusa]|uniref:SHSP domain-containing protein n=1 Tax=Caerostris extrusa TaxID=172846 RepID=A0AAV4X9F9_CAEEX|nr:hypothetical protein CEXT_552201 [Caerostris extrusa]
MAYVFDEVQCYRCDGSDWWNSFPKFPKTIVDQDFGYQMDEFDLVGAEKDAEKELDPECIKRKKEFVDSSGSSSVQLSKDKFTVFYKSQMFKKTDIVVKDDSAFLIITGEQFESDREVSFGRQFCRRYMIPYQFRPYEIDIKTGEGENVDLTIEVRRKP